MIKITWNYKSYCRHCGRLQFNLMTGFVHDIFCWSFKTAIHNLIMSLKQDLGLAELETEHDWLQSNGIDI